MNIPLILSKQYKLEDKNQKTKKPKVSKTYDNFPIICKTIPYIDFDLYITPNIDIEFKKWVNENKKYYSNYISQQEKNTKDLVDFVNNTNDNELYGGAYRDDNWLISSAILSLPFVVYLLCNYFDPGPHYPRAARARGSRPAGTHRGMPAHTPYIDPAIAGLAQGGNIRNFLGIIPPVVYSNLITREFQRITTQLGIDSPLRHFPRNELLKSMFWRQVASNGIDIPDDLQLPDTYEPTHDMINFSSQEIQKGNELYVQPPKGTLGFAIVLPNINRDWIGWTRAYHGTDPRSATLILDSSLRPGQRQRYENSNVLNHSDEQIGKGVYVTPNFRAALGYAHHSDVTINIPAMGNVNVRFKSVLQLAIRRPRKVEDRPEYWVQKGAEFTQTPRTAFPYRVCIFIQRVERATAAP